MRTGTFDSNAALGALMGVFGKTVEQAAPILAGANYTLAQVATALRTTGCSVPAPGDDHQDHRHRVEPVGRRRRRRGRRAIAAAFPAATAAGTEAAVAVAMKFAQYTPAESWPRSRPGLAPLRPAGRGAEGRPVRRRPGRAGPRDAYSKTAGQSPRSEGPQYDAHQVAIGLQLGLSQVSPPTWRPP